MPPKCHPCGPLTRLMTRAASSPAFARRSKGPIADSTCCHGGLMGSDIRQMVAPNPGGCTRSAVPERGRAGQGPGSRGTSVLWPEYLPDQAGDLEILTCTDDQGGRNRTLRRDPTIRLPGGVCRWVQSHLQKIPQSPQMSALSREDPSPAGTSGEHQGVQATQGHTHRCHADLDSVNVDVVGKTGVRVASVHGSDHLAKISRRPPESFQPRSCSRPAWTSSADRWPWR